MNDAAPKSPAPDEPDSGPRIHPAILHGFAEETGKALKQLAGVPAIAIVMVTEDGTAIVSMLGVPADVARMASAITRLAGTKPRPANCAACADAWDRLAQANAILLQPTGKC